MHRARADSGVFHAVADPTRRAILDRLRQGPRPVNALAGEFAQSRPAISRHLRVLRAACLVTEERAGRERHYRLEPARLAEVGRWIDLYRPFWEQSLGNLKRYLEQEQEP